MTLEEAIAWLGPRYVLSAQYQPQAHHASHAQVDVAMTFFRVRGRMRKERSLVAVAEKERQRLRLILGKVAA